MSFEDCMPPLLLAEDPWSDDPGDRGGGTVFGISSINFPKSPVFPIAHQLIAQNVDPSQWSKNVSLMGAVYAFYKQNFWNPCQLDYFPANLQEHCFGCAVNQGISGMAKMLQKALGRVGQVIPIDGDLGPATLKAVNSAPAGWLEDAFWRVRAEAYLADANADPKTQAQFLRGWDNRLESGL